MASPTTLWRSLRVSPREFSLRTTFKNGQCWCWKEVNATTWCGVVGPTVYLLRQQQHDVEYRVLRPATSSPSPTQLLAENSSLRSFLQLETNMEPLKQRWMTGAQKVNSDMSIILSCLPGMRVLRQDPLECLFSFMASANNNIQRIGHILMYWRVKWGTHVLTTNVKHDKVYTASNDPHYAVDVEQYVARFVHYKSKTGGSVVIDTETEEAVAKDKVHYFAFPTLAKLSTLTIADFRADNQTGCGLGYRDKTTVKTIALLNELGESMEGGGGREFLMQLRNETDGQVVCSSLQQFYGVGPKVADCVALFSLNQHSIVPADTHVVDIAERDFAHTALYQSCTSKSLTTTKRQVINACFVDAFGEYAGWAHCLLFAAELPIFTDRLPESLVKENQHFQHMKKQRAKERKELKKQREGDSGAMPPGKKRKTKQSTPVSKPKQSALVVASSKYF